MTGLESLSLLTGEVPSQLSFRGGPPSRLSTIARPVTKGSFGTRLAMAADLKGLEVGHPDDVQ